MKEEVQVEVRDSAVRRCE